ncbi:hypothetical protein HNY73_017934 [Argiope bruennichi]|uniref:Uncharacterized protein n=1 Tax=Argiope bruennichi TaxID=94029 RepID=A0A8T0EBK9_ARGBR|nr:hypothetical protein HNY73_017934 [Argiope bruennichi]
MDLFPPKQRDLELWLLKDSEIKMMPKTVWEIDAPFNNSLLWSITLSYLTVSQENGVLWESLRNLHPDNVFQLDSKIKRQFLRKIVKVIRKFNPFKNYHSIYWDRFMNLFVLYFRAIMNVAAINISNIPAKYFGYYFYLTKAAKILSCVIHVYKTSASGNSSLYTFYPEDNSSECNYTRLILFQHVISEESALTNEPEGNDKFSFALSLSFASPLRESALVHILKRANLSIEEIEQTKKAVKNKKSFLVALLQSSKEQIIWKLYKSPYIIRKLIEAGFDADPTSPDENGFSSFYHCMGLTDASMLRILYHFSTKNVLMIDNTIGNPDEILKALNKTAAAINEDWRISYGFFAFCDKKIDAFRRCLGILRFNEFQCKIVNIIFKEKQNSASDMQQKIIMISILEKYREYYYFLHNPRVTDTLELYQDFLKHSEYYEDLDNFFCLLFFHIFPSLTPLINEDNRNIFSNALSSLFLNILSERFFPKYDRNFDCRSGIFDDETSERSHSSRRFIVFSYRRRFSENAEAFAKELRNPTSTAQSSAKPLLEEITSCLIFLPEIEDEFLTIRLKRHLDTVAELTAESCATKAMLTIERTMQVLGETLQNETVSKTFVKFLLHVLLPPGIEHQFCIIRDHSLGDYRSSSVPGRLEIENNSKNYFRYIQEELKIIGIIFQSICLSQFFRVEELMIKTVEKEAESLCKELHLKISLQLREITNKRKGLFVDYGDSLMYLLTKTFVYFQDKVKKDSSEFLRDFEFELQVFVFLVNLINKHCNDDYPDELQNLTTELNNFISNLSNFKTPEEKKDKFKKMLSKYSDNLRNLFVKMNDQDLKFNFPYLNSMFVKMKDSSFFTLKEKDEMKQKISEYFKKSAETLQMIKQNFIPEELKDKLDIIIIREKEKNEIMKYIPTNVEKTLKLLKSVKEADTSTLFKTNESNMFTSMLLKEEYISALLKINFRPKLKIKVTKVINQRLWFLIDRISRLKKILIFEDEDISYLWKSGRWERNPEIEKRIKYLMMQRYFNEKDLRSSLEMLLFDCMNVLKKPKLITLWKKANYMFIGANMVQFLAHGNPVAESITALLYPEDMPSEIINEIFELIKDEMPLRALSELWEKAKVGNETIFKNIVSETKKDKWSRLRRCIMSSARWELYMSFLPLRR